MPLWDTSSDDAIEVVRLPEQELGVGAAQILLRLHFLDGYTLQPDKSSQAEWNNENESADVVSINEAQRSGRIKGDELRIPITLMPGVDVVYGIITLYYCKTGAESLCFIDQVSIEAPIRVEIDSENDRLTIDRMVTPPING